MPLVARNRRVDRDELDDFIRPRHRGVLLTSRSDLRPQASLVTMGLTEDSVIVVSSYPERAKVHNVRARPATSMVVMSDEFGGEWVQVDCTAEVVELPDALDGLEEYFRVISGEHPDWDEYRDAMTLQGKCLICLRIESWGPIASGGFPAAVAARLEAQD
jgi:PPOX class probable F420-dependent enzyme